MNTSVKLVLHLLQTDLTSSCAEPIWSIWREPFRRDCTICTARAPEEVFTVRSETRDAGDHDVTSATADFEEEKHLITARLIWRPWHIDNAPAALAI